jgi:hypothetical protein
LYECLGNYLTLLYTLFQFSLSQPPFPLSLEDHHDVVDGCGGSDDYLFLSTISDNLLKVKLPEAA